ncbi:hypothetical protein P879_08507 [Paragonimus westermani]|uniref:Uncharacterized protein n=1 Tax=Paragonimus westermani TaxID=34504 RepID=A0A8T0DG31_9TREM|nr:hypothetical protein P879_08507 [Paragonimus westermani]
MIQANRDKSSRQSLGFFAANFLCKTGQRHMYGKFTLSSITIFHFFTWNSFFVAHKYSDHFCVTPSFLCS